MKRFLIYVVVFFAGEASHFGVDLLRNYANLCCVEPIKAEQRQAAEDRGIQEYKEQKIRAGHPVVTTTSIAYYAVDKLDNVSNFDGKLPASEVVDILGKVDYHTLTSASLGSLPSGTQVTPFFLSNRTHDIAAADAPGKGRCVIAGLEGRIIFVPLQAYKAAGLPMRPEANR